MRLMASTALSARIGKDSRTIMVDVLDLQKPSAFINNCGSVVGEVIKQCVSTLRAYLVRS